MGKQRRRKLDLLSEQTGAVVVLGLAFFLCGLAGVLAAGLQSETGFLPVREYLTAYLRSVRETGGTVSFLYLLQSRFRILFLTVLLGSVPLGLLGLPLLFGWQGFLFAFPAACFFRMFGGRGFFPALAAAGVPGLLWLPLLFLAGTRGWVQTKEKAFPIRAAGNSPAGHSPGLRPGLYCVLLFVCVVLETIAVPALLRAAAQVVL